MTDSTDTLGTERHALEAELATAYANMGYWQRVVEQTSDRAEELRQIARALDFEVQPLRTVFSPLRGLHTAQTWEGQAATNSRNRLDEHELRCVTAIRAIDTLVDDLESEALQAESRAATAASSYDTMRRTAATLEIQLGRLDDVYI